MGDDDVLHPFDCDPTQLAFQLGTLARPFDLVLTHGSDGEYGHPAHKLLHAAVKLGVPQRAPRALVYTVAALVSNIEDRLWNRSEPAHFALDIRPWADAKAAAMNCHRTQHALFVRRRKLAQVRDAMRTVEAVRRLYPPIDSGELPDDDFARLLQGVGAWTPRE
jgi:LmbE family N-acetylglucosaminyl deacetylase